MGYPMTYPRVVCRNGLNGSYADTPGEEWKRMIAGDLRRLEQDMRDEHHIKLFAEKTSATAGEVQAILEAFFTDFGHTNVSSWLGADPHGRDAKLRGLLGQTYKPEGVRLWLAHAEKQGWSLDEQVRRARAMAEGVFS